MKPLTIFCCAMLLAAGVATAEAVPPPDVPTRDAASSVLGAPTAPSVLGRPTTPPVMAPPGRERLPAPQAPPFRGLERRGKYADPFDRRIPYQGKVHEGYKHGKKDPYKRH